MFITNNLERKLGCYIAEILLSKPYRLLGINSMKLCTHVQPTHTQEEARRHPANG